MEFRMLGPLEVVGDGGAHVPLGGRRPRALLALLLLHGNEVVSTDRLIDGIWGDRPPASAQGALQVHVHALRKALGPDRILTRAPGYLLRVGSDELDQRRFERLVAEGDLRGALALWRGPALADVADEPFAQAEAARLDEARLAALEARIAADLESGNDAGVIGELDALVAAHPHRERLQAHRMLALYRAGRQADALAAYRDARRALDELGIEPSAELRALERRILEQDPLLAPAGRVHEPSGPPSVLLGRDLDVTTIVALLGRTERGPVTIVGPGGVGKTALAREVARELGVSAFVELASVEDPAAVASAIVRELGLDEDPARPPLDVVVDGLNDDPRTLVLDNLEHLDTAPALVEELLERVSGLRVVATSRKALRIAGEREYRLRPLEIPAAGATSVDALAGIPSIELYVARARRLLPAFALTEANAPAVARICRLVDGLPLGVELAAARILVLGPEQTAERLGEGIALLRRSAPGVPERQQSVRAAIDWSYRLLEEDRRRCFRALGVLAGGGTLDLVEAVCAGTDVDASDVVEELLDASLLEHEADADGEPRFSMLQPIREFALELLAAHGEADVVRDRHLAHLLTVATAADRARRTDVVAYPRLRFRRDLDNLRAALDHAERSGEREDLQRLTVALAIYWTLDELVDEGLRWFERAQAAGTTGDPELRFHVVNGLAVFAYLKGDIARALEQNESALEVTSAAQIPSGDLGRALRLRSSIANAAGRPDEALAALERAIPLLEQAGDAASAGRSLIALAEAHRKRGEFPQAVAAAQRGAAVLGAIGDDEGRGFCLLVAGAAQVSAGEYRPAFESIRVALPVAAAAADVTTVESCILIRARIAAGLGELELAAKLVGFAEAAYAGRGEDRWEIEREYWEPTFDTVRDGLGKDELRRLTLEGAGMGLDVAASLASEAAT